MQARRPRRGPQEPIDCTKCGGRDAIQIELALPDGAEVHFASCHRCEHRWWSFDGEIIDLTSVLERARRR